MISNNLTCIQNILIPNKTFGSSSFKYMVSNLVSYSEDEIVIFSGGVASFDTYYNALSLPVWKEQCGLNKITFCAKGLGKAIVKLFVATSGVDYELTNKTVELEENEQMVLEYELSKIEHNGLLYVTISPMEDKVIFKSGGWYTIEQSKRNVVLGISVTHFNRKKYVLPAIERVKKNLLDNPKYKDKILFTVVDNSNNITKEEASGVNIIPNENTGGSGGFMRGLLHYENDTNATHVLFMDDDASCETESITRAYWILSYVIKSNSAVCGSLFIDDRPDILIEKGASFVAYGRPNSHNFNMAVRESLIASEIGHQPKINYGAWWFFAFPIKHIKNYTFPFFVRGDDIFFSLSNNFNYIAPIGIACYGESFSTKTTPLTIYLDMRNNIVNALYLKTPVKKIIRTYKRMFLTALYAHKYESVAAIRLAFNHVFGDINFWYNNYDLKEVRESISNLVNMEKFINIDLDKLKPIYAFKPRKKIIKKLTFNGLLLPMKNKLAYQEFNFGANADHIYRHKNILYYKPNNKKGFIVKVSRIKFFKLLFCLYMDMYKMRSNYQSNVTKYKNNIGNLTSKEFWTKVLKL